MPVSPSPRRRPARPSTIATALAAAGLMVTAVTVPATAQPATDPATAPSTAPATAQGLRPAPTARAQARTVTLGGDDRVSTTAVDRAGRSTVLPLPRPDGTRPGLLLSSSDTATTVQATDRHRAPTILAGRARAAIDSAAAAATIDVRLAAIGRDGRAAGGFVAIYDVETGAVEASRQLTEGLDHDCTTDGWAVSDCIRLPAGTYSIMAFVETNPPGTAPLAESRTLSSVALVGDPQLTISRARTVTFDARRAVPLRVDTPGHRTKINPEGAMQFGYRRTAANGQQITRSYQPTALLDNTFYFQPTEQVTVGSLDTLTRVRLEAPDITMQTVSLRPRTLHPEYYDPVWFSDFARDWPTFDGAALRRVVDVGHAAAGDLADRSLRGAVAVAERSEELSVAAQSNAAAAAGASMIVIYNDRPGDNDDPGGTGVKVTIPTLRISRAEGLALVRLAAARGTVSITGEDASPYLYDLVIKESGRIPADLHHSYPVGRLTRQLRQVHGQPTIGATFSESAYQFQPGDEFSISTMFPFRDGPRTRTEYRLPDPDTRWTYAVVTPELSYNALFPHDPVLPMTLSDPQIVAYQPHQRLIMPVGTAPITAAPNQPVQRAGDRMLIDLNGFTDADGNGGWAYSSDSGMSTLLQITADGALIAETPNLPSGIAALPAGSSTVSIAFRTDNPQPWAQLSTHTSSRWTFPSSTTPDGAVVTEPLILTDYDLDTDLHNRLSGRTFELALRHQDGSAAAMIDTVRLDASYDDGSSWQPTRITPVDGQDDHDPGDGGRYRVRLPAGHGPVSLRLRVSDAAGSSLDQTTIRAVWVR